MTTMPKRTTSFRDDLLADLVDPQDAAAYLNAALEESDEMFLVALRDVAEARQMARVAEGAGVARESVYRMLTAKGNPTYTSLLGILRAVGLKMAISAEAKISAQPTQTSEGESGEKSGSSFEFGANEANESREQNRFLEAGGDMGRGWNTAASQSSEGASWQRKGMATAMSMSQPHEFLQASTR